MSVVWQRFFVLTILLLTDAKPISNGNRRSQEPIGFTPEMLLYLQLLQSDDGAIRSVRGSGGGVDRSAAGQSGVLLFVQPTDNRNSGDVITDPNILLMLENFQSDKWPQSGAGSTRLTRQMSPAEEAADPPYLETGTSRGTFLWLVPRRNPSADPPTPSAVLHPPPASQAAVTAAAVAATPSHKSEAESVASKATNKVSGRSISSSQMSPNQSGSADEESPDFLSTLVTIPQVWMHDLSHMIIQPLRKPSSGERDSFEYFGMVGKAPFIQCPLGFKKSSLGNHFLFAILPIVFRFSKNLWCSVCRQRYLPASIPQSQKLSGQQPSGIGHRILHRRYCGNARRAGPRHRHPSVIDHGR